MTIIIFSKKSTKFLKIKKDSISKTRLSLKIYAGDRNRTGTMLPPQDFKSCASASSATPASMYLVHLLCTNGWRRIRTFEVVDNRFTVCPLWPLGKSPIFSFKHHWWSWWTDLNPRPADYKSAALPTELHQHVWCLYIISQRKRNVNTFFHFF